MMATRERRPLHIPTVVAELVNEDQWRIRCPWCKDRRGRAAYHYHGAGVPGEPDFPIAGHRVEHCHRPDGPYSRYGYWLVPEEET